MTEPTETDFIEGRAVYLAATGDRPAEYRWVERSLDARIRAGLDGGDWSTRGLSNALRKVLDVINDVQPYEHPDADDIRRIIASELGVSSD